MTINKNKFNFRQIFMIAVLLFSTIADILIDYVKILPTAN